MPFNLMSAADPQGRCRSFVEANMRSQKPTHWFHDLEAQTESRPCTIHPYARQCESSPMLADVGICGTPCHPYSFQRVGRHRPGSVQGHAEFEVGMRMYRMALRLETLRYIIFPLHIVHSERQNALNSKRGREPTASQIHVLLAQVQRALGDRSPYSWLLDAEALSRHEHMASGVET